MPGNAYAIKSVTRVLSILEDFALSEAPRTLTAISERVGLPPSTTLRFLRTLEGLGYVSRQADGTYARGQRLRSLAGWVGGVALKQAARPAMDWLVERCGEDVLLNTLDVQSALCIEIAKASHLLTVAVSTGFQMPLHATAAGKVLLAFLDPIGRKKSLDWLDFRRYTEFTVPTAEALARELEAIREQGYALDSEEFIPGVACLAVPVHHPRHSQVAAALSVTAPVKRCPPDRLRQYLPDARDAAERITAALAASS